MSKPTSVIDPHGNYEESIQRIALHLGRSVLRRDVFNCIYGRGSRPKTTDDILQQLQLGENMRQQVVNELNVLSSREIVSITKVPKPGSAKATLNAYSKLKFVSAYKEKILKLADNPKRAKSIVTKRSNPIFAPKPVPQYKSKRASAPRAKVKILYMIASPLTADPLAVQTEVRLVQDALRGSKHRDKIEVHWRPAADLKSLKEGLNDVNPSIVHFSGHGGPLGLLGDDSVPTWGNNSDMNYELICDALAAVDAPPRLVILNACETQSAETSLLEHCDAAITMSVPIGDAAAISFALGFYAAIGAGQSLQSAYRQGKAQVKIVAPGEVETPKLKIRKDLDAKQIVFVS